MRNALRVLRRDLGRFARARLVWAILIGIIIIPSLYAWVNIIAFWHPYSTQNTKNVNVAIVNLDKGASSELTGKLNVGNQMVAQIKKNHDLGWQFFGKQKAMAAVESGESYAAIVVPPDFSKNLLSLATPDFVRPELEYYVNVKANPIAPKITEVGASTLQTQVNATFVSTVAKKVAQKASEAGVAAENRLAEARNNVLNALNNAVDRVATARDGLTDVKATLEHGNVALSDANAALISAQGTIGSVQTSVTEVEELVAQVQRELIRFTDSVTSAYVSGTAQLAGVSSELNAKVAAVSAAVQRASGAIAATVDDVEAVVEANTRTLAQLEDLLSTAPHGLITDAVEKAVAEMKEGSQAADQILGRLQALDTDVARIASNIDKSSDRINKAVQRSAKSATGIRKVLMDTIPDVNQAMSALSSHAATFSSSLDTQSALVSQAVNLSTDLQEQLKDTEEALTALDGNLGDAQRDLRNLQTDIAALSSAKISNQLRSLTELKPEQIAEFMTSPVEVKRQSLFPINTYGSAMAPLFTNLALWIGAFMLVVLIKLEVDTQGIAGLTVRQAYFGRWMLLAIFNIFQALLVSIGDIVIGVQMANAPAFLATSVFTGLVYVSIIYALTMSFGYIGKGIAILLVIIQIPGASGIYPIEMMPDFFQKVFPFLPFTYGIDAMRETIGGFYGASYWRYIAVLLAFAIFSFLLGVLLRQRLGNLARLLNRNLGDSGLFLSEDVQILGSRRRLAQIAQALTDREQFRRATARQAAWMDKHQVPLRWCGLFVGLMVTAALVIIGLVFPDAKATMLGLWGVLCLLVIAFLVALEYIRQNLNFAKELGDVSDSDLAADLIREEKATHSSTALSDLAERRAQP